MLIVCREAVRAVGPVALKESDVYTLLGLSYREPHERNY